MSDSIRKFVETLLEDRGKSTAFTDTEALFTSGLLDSLAATELMVHLETEHGVDLSNADFDVSKLDTIQDLSELLAVPA